MLIYGISTRQLKDKIIWKNMIHILQNYDFDAYKTLVENNYTDNDAENWFSEYESEGRKGIGAFLYDIIKDAEELELDIDDPDGNVYIGISAAAPWEFHPSVKSLSKEHFDAIMNKYVVLITGEETCIQWWKVDDDLDW